LGGTAKAGYKGFASENRDWGYDRIAGTMANLGHAISDETVGNVLRRNGPPPASERKRTTPWSVFIRTHLALLAGTDFFTADVLTRRGLVTYYVLFFIHFESRRVNNPVAPRHHCVRSSGAACAAAEPPPTAADCCNGFQGFRR
jgi:hypothetical protein